MPPPTSHFLAQTAAKKNIYRLILLRSQPNCFKAVCILFSQKECSNQKNYSIKVDQGAKNEWMTHFQTLLATLLPLAAIFDFAGGVALQAVSDCPPLR